MATLTLTNLFGNNTTVLSANSIQSTQDRSEVGATGTAISVTAGHRYYARATVTVPSHAGTNQSHSTGVHFGVSDSVYVCSLTRSPSSGITTTSKTSHRIFQVPDNVTSVIPTLEWGITANTSPGTHTGTFLLLVDVTTLENNLNCKFTADEFWTNILGSSLFTTTKSITYTPSSNAMNITDFNGTSYYEIKGIEDNNGTTSYPIGTVYDNNGTSSSLIWSSETAILDGGNSTLYNLWDIGTWNGNTTTYDWDSTGKIPGQTATISSFNGNVYSNPQIKADSLYVGCTHNAIGYNGATINNQTAFAINGHSKMNITYTCGGTFAGSDAQIGLATTRKAAGHPATTPFKNLVVAKQLSRKTTSQTVSLDISGLSAGNYYVTLVWVINSGNGETETLTITKITID